MPTGGFFAPRETAVGPLELDGDQNIPTADRQTSSLAKACAAPSVLMRIEPWSSLTDQGD
ncbi:hypothetical protein [Jiella mangrovi]|nr:hypothetical protein [Jiella mangrovi]